MRPLTTLAGYIIAAIILLSITSSPVFGWPNNFHENSLEASSLPDRLDTIDDQVSIISQDRKIMRFGNVNMHDQGISIIAIQIIDNGVVQRNYYIEKSVAGEPATIHSGMNSNYDWIFTPTVEQAEEALVVYKSRKVTTHNIIKSITLIKSIENENVPSITTLINNMSNTTWNKITKYLPNSGNWIIHLLV